MDSALTARAWHFLRLLLRTVHSQGVHPQCSELWKMLPGFSGLEAPACLVLYLHRSITTHRWVHSLE